MRQFDGLRLNTRQSAPRPSLPSAPLKQQRRKSAPLFLILLTFVALAFFMRPNKQPPNAFSTTSPVSTGPAAGDSLTLPQDTKLNTDQTLEGIVILDQPNTDSLPQEATTTPSEPTESNEQPAIQEFTLRILNGSGVSGAAATMQTTLEQAGMAVTSIGTALNSHATTTLYYLAGKREFAERVAAASGKGNVRYVEDTVASPADVLLVIGSE